MSGVAAAIFDELNRVGALSADQLAENLGESVGFVEQALVDNHLVFQTVGDTRVWSVASPESFGAALYLNRLMRRWQVEALQKWLLSGRSSLVEAVTGAGKTDLALAAIVEARRRGLAALIVVPDQHDIDAWSKALSTGIPSSIVAQVDRGTGSLDAYPILLARSSILGDRRLRFARRERLLIIDEVDQLSVTDFANLTKIGTVTDKLGLTAAYEWPDLGAESVLKPYFGDVIDGCDYLRAVEDRMMAPPVVVAVGVDFTDSEARDYRIATDKASALTAELLDADDGSPEGALSLARRLDADAAVGPRTSTARALLGVDRDRRTILSRCTAKMSVVSTLRKAMHNTDLSAVYFDYDGADGTDTNVQPRKTAQSTPSVGVLLSVPRTPRSLMGLLARVFELNSPSEAFVTLVYVRGTMEDPQTDSAAASLALLREIALDFNDVNESDALSLLLLRASERDGWLDVSLDSGFNEGGPIEGPDTWSVVDAIKDIFDDYQGFPLWEEIRELLPDIDAEQTLRQGVDGISWMPVGSALVGAGGPGTRIERIRALSVLADVFEELGAHAQELSDLAQAFSRSALLSENMTTNRIRELWTGLGGRVAPGDRAPVEVRSVDDVMPLAADVDMSPALRRVLVAFDAAVSNRGGAMRGPLGSRKDEYEVLDARGVRRTVRLAADDAEGWSVPKAELNQASNAVRVFMSALDHHRFYIFTAPEFQQVAREATKNSTFGQKGKAKSKIIVIPKRSVVAGLDKWEKLGTLAMPSAASANSTSISESRVRRAYGTSSVDPASGGRSSIGAVEISGTGAQKFSPDASIVEPSDQPLFDSAGRIRVTLKVDSHSVPGALDTVTGQLQIAEVEVAGKNSGKLFRNAATAASAVRSMNKPETTFSDGISEWTVDGTNGKFLTYYLDQSSWTIEIPEKSSAG
ncbi:DEAD/DEAH box helicase [Rhodococcus sp. IEGM 1330]|uniref:DEAD/DEAH box helicase n=1 Tax=Rhodococcus sp. IEGM 1330 TaxID=3082225 RepID=UPI0029544870|nr:DEAD/DEAH box helicase [Rhodococcus sp. IEGM 1330]MDV8023809.1 hypothetical protein [Rhodococcus sp. IEGM 1330]